MMYKEIEKQALELLEKECPDEVKIYTRWERCIKMYTDGFRSVPQTMEGIIDWFYSGSPFDLGYKTGQLSIPLHFVNHAIHTGHWFSTMSMSSDTALAAPSPVSNRCVLTTSMFPALAVAVIQVPIISTAIIIFSLIHISSLSSS